mgnify:CR=1 FL=1
MYSSNLFRNVYLDVSVKNELKRTGFEATNLISNSKNFEYQGFDSLKVIFSQNLQHKSSLPTSVEYAEKRIDEEKLKRKREWHPKMATRSAWLFLQKIFSLSFFFLSLSFAVFLSLPATLSFSCLLGLYFYPFIWSQNSPPTLMSIVM